MQLEHFKALYQRTKLSCACAKDSESAQEAGRGICGWFKTCLLGMKPSQDKHVHNRSFKELRGAVDHSLSFRESLDEGKGTMIVEATESEVGLKMVSRLPSDPSFPPPDIPDTASIHCAGHERRRVALGTTFLSNDTRFSR